MKNWITIGGVSRPFIYWCREFGVRADTARYRLKIGLSIEDVFRKERIDADQRGKVNKKPEGM